jgi:hypothetical protein
MPTSIVVLGEGCTISFELERLRLKGPSSIFEWHQSTYFKDVLYILQLILQKKVIEPRRDEVGFPGNYFLENTRIRTAHYELSNYKEIIHRRTERLLSDIMSGNNILFIREEAPHLITYEDVETFSNLILAFNPSCKFKLLVLSQGQFEKITHTHLIHAEFNKQTNLSYILSCFDEPPQNTVDKAVDTD